MHKEFEVHALNVGGIARANAIADAFDGLLRELEVVVTNHASREFRICCTKLEEASFFAKKALALEARNQRGGTGAIDEASIPDAMLLQGDGVRPSAPSAPLPPPPASMADGVDPITSRPPGVGRVDPRTGRLMSE